MLKRLAIILLLAGCSGVMAAAPIGEEVQMLCGKNVESMRYYRILDDYKIHIRIIDGDTQEVVYYLEDDLFRRAKLRLLGVDTPEPYGTSRKEGIEAKKFAKDWYETAKSLKIYYTKRGKYGRPLAIVCNEEHECLNHALLATKHAKYNCGGSRKVS